MSRRKIELLRDDVIRAARQMSDALDLGDSFITGSYRDRAYLCRALRAAVGAHDAYLNEITSTAGEWVDGAPATSRRAAIAVTPRTGSLRKAIVNEIFINGRSTLGIPDGLTTDELEQRLRRPHTSVSSAVNWLKNNGWLEASGYTRSTRAGHDAEIMRLTRAALTNLEGGSGD